VVSLSKSWFDSDDARGVCVGWDESRYDPSVKKASSWFSLNTQNPV